MNDQLSDFRIEVTGRPPEELPRAKALLLAEINRPLRPRTVRWRGPALFGGIAAGLAAALVVTLLPGGTARPPQHPSGTGTTTLTADYVLERAASAAASVQQPVPRPDQFVYVSSVTTYLSIDGDASGHTRDWLYRTRRQIWLSADGLRTGLLWIMDLPNVKLPWGPVPPANSGDPVGWTSLAPVSCPGAAPSRGTYTFLAALPADPAALRTWIYRHPDGQNPPDEQAWTDIGDMLREMLVPPKLAAALFRVAATIPGATVVTRATNAVGRVGVAVSRSGEELIFDPRTYQFIGEGAVLTKPVAGQGPAGTVTASTAQLQVKVVSRLPYVPPSQMDKAGTVVSC